MSDTVLDWRYDETVRGWTLADWDEDGRLAGEPHTTLDLASLSAAAPAARRHIARNAYLRSGGITLPASAFDGPPDARTSLTCEQCWWVSFQPDRAALRICGECGHKEGAPVDADGDDVEPGDQVDAGERITPA